MKYRVRAVDEEGNNIWKSPLDLKLELGNNGFCLIGPNGELLIDASLINRNGEFWVGLNVTTNGSRIAKIDEDNYNIHFQIVTNQKTS